MKVRVCGVGDVPENDMAPFDVEGMPVLVACIKGKHYAIADTCSHADASLAEGYLDTGALTVECPLHAAVFDLRSGEALEFPAETPVASFEVQVEGEDVYIVVPQGD